MQLKELTNAELFCKLMPANWIKEYAESKPEHTESEGRTYQLCVLGNKRMGN